MASDVEVPCDLCGETLLSGSHGPGVCVGPAVPCPAMYEPGAAQKDAQEGACAPRAADLALLGRVEAALGRVPSGAWLAELLGDCKAEITWLRQERERDNRDVLAKQRERDDALAELAKLRGGQGPG